MTPLLQNLLSDDAGNTSSIRVVLLVSTSTILGVWAFVSITSRSMQEIPQGVLFLFGTAIGGKLIQKCRENVAGVKNDTAGSAEVPEKNKPHNS